MRAAIFISHSSKDQRVAGTIASALENRGLQCWLASRDVGPGQNFQEAIVRAIRIAKVMVLVFSENANNSDEIKKEIVLANQSRVVVIPVRVEDVVPNEAFAYEFATRQWIDLFDDWEQALARLSTRISAICSAESETPPEVQPAATAAGIFPAIAGKAGFAFKMAYRTVPGVGFSIGVSCIALLVALAMLVSGYARVAGIILSGILVAILITTALAGLLFTRSPGTRKIGIASIWGVSLLLVLFLVITATAVQFRWPVIWASALGYEDGVVCSRPTEVFAAFSCGPQGGTHIVSGIPWDDLDGGLTVREGPYRSAIARGFIPPNATDLVVGACQPGTRVQTH